MLHFTVCPTNPKVMPRKLEHQEQAEHNRRMDLAAEARATVVSDLVRGKSTLSRRRRQDRGHEPSVPPEPLTSIVMLHRY